MDCAGGCKRTCLHKHTQCTQAEQCAVRRWFLKHRVEPEAERANTELEKLAMQR